MSFYTLKDLLLLLIYMCVFVIVRVFVGLYVYVCIYLHLHEYGVNNFRELILLFHHVSLKNSLLEDTFASWYLLLAKMFV